MQLTESIISEELSKASNGEMLSITYKSELPLKAASKKAGHSVLKITEVLALIGVPYSSLPEVIEYRKKQIEQGVDPSSSVHRANNYEEILPNRMYYNTNTEKTYIRFITRAESERKSRYIVDGVEVETLSDEQRDLVINSHWNKPAKADDEVVLPIQQNINVENVLAIGNVGDKYFE